MSAYSLCRPKKLGADSGCSMSVVLCPDAADLLDLVDGQLAGAPLFVDQLASDFHRFAGAETG